MEAIPKGSTVRQIVKPIEGKVVETKYNEDKQQLSHLVEYTADKEPHSRWFTGDELTVVNTPKQVEDAAAAANTSATQGAKA